MTTRSSWLKKCDNKLSPSQSPTELAYRTGIPAPRTTQAGEEASTAIPRNYPQKFHHN